MISAGTCTTAQIPTKSDQFCLYRSKAESKTSPRVIGRRSTSVLEWSGTGAAEISYTNGYLDDALTIQKRHIGWQLQRAFACHVRCQPLDVDRNCSHIGQLGENFRFPADGYLVGLRRQSDELI